MKTLPPVLVHHPHVTVDPAVFGGSPVVAGTRVPIRRLWAWHQKGVPVAILVQRYPSLGWVQILDALSFAYDNPDLMEADLARERALLEKRPSEQPVGRETIPDSPEAKREGPSPEALKRKEAFVDAVAAAVAEHHAAGRSVAVYRDGKVQELPSPPSPEQVDAADGRLRILRAAFDKAPQDVRETAWWRETIENALRMTPEPVLDETEPPEMPEDLHAALVDWCWKHGVPISMRNDLKRALRLDEIQELRDRTTRSPGVPTFEEAWAQKEAEGYQYGRDALERVQFGWEIRDGYESAQVRTLADYARLLERDAHRANVEQQVLVKNICDRILERIEGAEFVVEEIKKDFGNGVELPECFVVPNSSRACEIGTKGCESQHLEVPKPEEHVCGASGEVGAKVFLACRACQLAFAAHANVQKEAKKDQGPVDPGRACPDCGATLVDRSGVALQSVLSVAKKLVLSWNSEAYRMPTRRSSLVQELRAAMQKAGLFRAD